MTWCSRALALVGLWLLAPAGAAAEDAPRGPINVDVIVSHVTRQPEASPSGGSGQPELAQRLSPAPQRVREIDERLRRIDEKLRGRFRYDRMELVERHRMVLGPDEVGTVRLPNGHRFQARLLDVDERGALIAVDVENSVKLDVRAPSGHPVIIGAEAYRDGHLVISVEPSY